MRAAGRCVMVEMVAMMAAGGEAGEGGGGVLKAGVAVAVVLEVVKAGVCGGRTALRARACLWAVRELWGNVEGRC